MTEAPFFPFAVQLQRSPPGGVVPVPAAAAGRGAGHELREGISAGIAGKTGFVLLALLLVKTQGLATSRSYTAVKPVIYNIF